MRNRLADPLQAFAFALIPLLWLCFTESAATYHLVVEGRKLLDRLLRMRNVLQTNPLVVNN